jgi:hypothetical protein
MSAQEKAVVDVDELGGRATIQHAHLTCAYQHRGPLLHRHSVQLHSQQP